MILHQGYPKEIISDQGWEFCNQVINRLKELTGFQRQVTSVYYLQSNGLDERMNQTLKGHCRSWSMGIKRIGISYLIMFSLLIIQADGARMTRWRCQGSQHIWRRFWWREGSWLKSILTWPSNCYFLILMADRWLWGTATWGNPDTPYLWHGPLGNLK